MVVVLVPIAAWAVLWCHPPEMDRIDGVDFRVHVDSPVPLPVGSLTMTQAEFDEIVPSAS